MWPNRYEDLLLEWNKLRFTAKDLPFEDALHLVHNWWQRAPLVNHYLHIADYESWPLPWDLLADNTFCDLAKCLGIVYTLILLNRFEIYSLRIIQTDNYYLVDVNNGQYILNDQPGEICSDEDFTVRYTVDAEYLKTKIK